MLTPGLGELSRKKWLWASITVNLGFLVIFKYLDMIIEWLNQFRCKLMELNCLCNICFYPLEYHFTHSNRCPIRLTFIEQMKKHLIHLSNSLAMYRSSHNLLGPIVRAKHFHSELTKERSFTVANLKIGLAFIIFGLF